MTITANLADGRVLNFPDGTSPEVVQATVQKMLGTQAPQAQPAQPQQPEHSFLDKAVGAADIAAQLGSGVLQEVGGGLAGILGATTAGPDDQYHRFYEGAQDMLSREPQSKYGKEKLQQAGEIISEVGEHIPDWLKEVTKVNKYIGDPIFEALGSESFAGFVAGLATSAPQMAIELASTKGAGKALKTMKAVPQRHIDKMIKKAAPDPDTLIDTAKKMYDELEELNVTVDAKAYAELVTKLEKKLKKKGFKKPLAKKAEIVLKEFRKNLGKEPTWGDLDVIREMAQTPANVKNLKEARYGIMIIDELDRFLKNPPKGAIKTPPGVNAPNVGMKHQLADKLYGQGARSKTIHAAFKAARESDDPFGEAIKKEFKKLMNNKREMKYFSENDKKAMMKVRRGTTGVNLFRFGGMFRGSGGPVRLAASATAGAFSNIPFGWAVLPGIGTVSQGLANRMTKGSAMFADKVIRAGKDGNAIVRAYMTHTPKVLWEADEVAELLMKADVDLSNLPKGTFSDMAKQKAMQRRAELAGTAALPAAQGLQPEENR